MGEETAADLKEFVFEKRGHFLTIRNMNNVFRTTVTCNSNALKIRQAVGQNRPNEKKAREIVVNTAQIVSINTATKVRIFPLFVALVFLSGVYYFGWPPLVVVVVAAFETPYKTLIIRLSDGKKIYIRYSKNDPYQEFIDYIQKSSFSASPEIFSKSGKPSTSGTVDTPSVAETSTMTFYREFFSRFYGAGSNGVQTAVPFNDQAQQFISHHEDLFPANTADAKEKVNSMVSANLSYENIVKNESECLGKVLSFSGKVIQIEKLDLTLGAATVMFISDGDQNIYEAVYKGETGLQKGDIVHMVATPDVAYAFNNNYGGTTQSVFIIAAYVEKISNDTSSDH